MTKSLDSCASSIEFACPQCPLDSGVGPTVAAGLLETPVEILWDISMSIASIYEGKHFILNFYFSAVQISHLDENRGVSREYFL